MKLTWRVAALAVVAAFGGCSARDVRTTFPRRAPAAEEAPRASIELRFSSTVDNLIVTVNGALVVSRADTSRVTIVDVPAGPTEVILAADGIPERALHVDLAGGQALVVPVAAPVVQRAPSVWQTLLGTGLTIAYLALRSAW